MSHPFPFIEELKDITVIDSFERLIRINDFVFSLIPYTIQPFSGDVSSDNIQNLYKGFKSKTIGGWCRLNAHFLMYLLKEYNIPSYCYDYGIKNKTIDGFTHMVVIVDYLGMPFLFDPYFSRYYLFEDKFPLQFYDMIDLLHRRSFIKISSCYGNLEKPFLTLNKWVSITPQEFEKHIFDSFNDIGFKEKMTTTFMDTNPLLMILLGQR